MMDRNLGATSARRADTECLGLIYQWGRKDPFLNSSSLESSKTEATSTITWPAAVRSDANTGTVAYATAHPTTFILYNQSNFDWLYTGSRETDNTRWTESDKDKSMYDPCPVGWRVPDGGKKGVWAKAFGTNKDSNENITRDKKGVDFSGTFSSAGTIWYPAAGRRDGNNSSLGFVGSYGYYWSASPSEYYGAYNLDFCPSDGMVYTTNAANRSIGNSVRCVKEKH